MSLIIEMLEQKEAKPVKPQEEMNLSGVEDDWQEQKPKNKRIEKQFAILMTAGINLIIGCLLMLATTTGSFFYLYRLLRIEEGRRQTVERAYLQVNEKVKILEEVTKQNQSLADSLQKEIESLSRKTSRFGKQLEQIHDGILDFQTRVTLIESQLRNTVVENYRLDKELPLKDHVPLADKRNVLYEGGFQKLQS